MVQAGRTWSPVAVGAGHFFRPLGLAEAAVQGSEDIPRAVLRPYPCPLRALILVLEIKRGTIDENFSAI